MKLTSGNVSFDCRELFFEDFTTLKQNEAAGGYKVYLWPNDYCGELTFYFPLARKDKELEKLQSDSRFRKALSYAINRQEIIDVIYRGIGEFHLGAADVEAPVVKRIAALAEQKHASAGSDDGKGIGKTEFVMLGSVLAVGGFYQIAVGAAMNTTVVGAKTEQVGLYHHSTVLGYRKIEVGKDFTVSVKGEHSEIAEKDRKIETKQHLVIDAAESITLRVGKSKFTMNKAGEIVIEGKELNIKTTADTVIKAKNVKTN